MREREKESRDSGGVPSDAPWHARAGRGLRGPVVVLLAGLALAAAGCSTAAGVKRVGLRDAYTDINVNALNAREASEDSKVVLHRYDLVERFDKDPAAALAILRDKGLGDDDRRDLRFAFAELSFLYADHLKESIDPEEHRQAPVYFMQAALSAYSYLLGPSREPRPGGYDRRYRVACDLHNRALGMALAGDSGGVVALGASEWKLPLGTLDVSLDTSALPWPLDSFESIRLADDYAVRGFTLRNRTPGLGVPLIAVQRPEAGKKKGIAIPVTAFLRFAATERGRGGGRFSATVELHSAYEEVEVSVNDRKVPLETDSTAPLAYTLEDPFVWNAGVKRFLKVEARIDPGTSLFQPYLPGRIPVVFVHGTASSPVWWAEMINTLRGDAFLRKKFQYWYFQYNSNGPITISASQLRESLTKLVRELDPEGKDPALRKMVVIGHSQGGLLTKMTAVDTGDRLWRSMSDEPLESSKLAPQLKESLRNYLFIEPLPFVKRVVFISTPHRGSYRTYGWVRSLVRKLVTLPAELTGTVAEVFKSGGDQLKLPLSMRNKIPTSIDGMSADNPILMALVATPIVPSVKAHSIIAVEGDGDYRTGADGVVKYTSAHLDGVESEYIVRSGHSCQGHPLTIEEVRRILLEHAGAAAPPPVVEPGQGAEGNPGPR